MSRLVEVVDRGTLVHNGETDLRRSLEDTVRITRPDGSWRRRRRGVTVPITSTMALLTAVNEAVPPRAVPAIYVR